MKFLKILIFIFLFKINTVFGELKTIDKIVALVNQDIILDSNVKNKIKILKYDTNLNQTFLQDKWIYYTVLNQLIIDHLLLKMAIQANVTINHDEFNQIIHYVPNLHNMTEIQFDKYLQNTGLNYNKYCLEIYQEMIKKIVCQQIVYQQFHMSSDYINNINQKLHYIDFNKQFKLTHIIINFPVPVSSTQINQSELLSKFLIKERKLNHDIQHLIYTYYNDNIFPRVIIQDKEWINWKDIPVIFDQYLNTAKPGDIIGPISSYDGIHILEIKEIRFKEHKFPIINIKINSIISKDTSNNKHIEQKLTQIKKKIDNGEITFDLILQKKLKNFYLENYENSLGWINLDFFNPSIQKSLMLLKKNQVSMPIYTSNGWCLIKLIDIDISNYTKMIYERAYSYMLYQKFNENLMHCLKELKAKSYIKIMN